MADVEDKIYYFKQYRRLARGSTGGTLVNKIQIRAAGFAHAEQLARGHLSGIDFETDFVILDGEFGYARCWFTGKENA